MPKLKALHTLALESKRVRAGETFSVKDPVQAAQLIAGGSAEEVVKPAAPAPPSDPEKEEKTSKETKEDKAPIQTKDTK